MVVEIIVPKEFKVPERLETPRFLIRKLMVGDAKLDYAAVMSSINIILKTRGGTWPTKKLTLDEDIQDLAVHQKEFEDRTSFAFTVMNPTQTECLGCFYFYPVGTRGKAPENADVDVSFWVIQKAYDRGLYGELYKTIRDWLASDWLFKKPFWTNTEIPEV